ncbi:Stp1/IreP family PP2C-type Ser/Thr phosphatase [Spirulina subsalsa FACHB-351]|uniref:Stp1/IreP family PP2C-type Ser/Thr phosphatase n=1 Tax=Spirulina subsalsa FACHB-351 TaxID=234711 RepID=A0ABT3L9V3_9CYAN|nr:Stp1/IreP family PP2C-type Ser/Thr phosphatase [Spirulina subsalsa]MCW6038269.1 Stp1/IreP family PP2C-type Ser/Thr phosphatase [Spirulina subsalsa FACHB-351]
MKRRFTGLTDTGCLRSVNQDDFYIDPDGRFFIVADGMGGHAGGQEASQIATRQIQVYLNEHWESGMNSKQLLEKAIFDANQGILKDQEIHPERADMGTTVVVVLFRDTQPLCAHIGDSRIYRLRDHTLEQVTEDQTWVARAMKMGDLSAEAARVHPWRHVLSQCLGRKDLQKIDIQPLDVQAGDRLLLCSDGLTEEVPDPDIEMILGQSKTCKEAAQALIDNAKDNGGSDNITVVIVVQD